MQVFLGYSKITAAKYSRSTPALPRLFPLCCSEKAAHTNNTIYILAKTELFFFLLAPPPPKIYQSVGLAFEWNPVCVTKNKGNIV